VKPTSDNGANTEFSTQDFNFGVTATYFVVVPGARSFTFSSGDAAS
jgi:hypothetical protein